MNLSIVEGLLGEGEGRDCIHGSYYLRAPSRFSVRAQVPIAPWKQAEKWLEVQARGIYPVIETSTWQAAESQQSWLENIVQDITNI